MIYLWSALGQLLFGGELYKTNPKLKGQSLEYFDSHLEVYNFNDMVLGAVTMFFVTITDWVEPVASVCLALHETYSFKWFLVMGFWLSFYVGSVLIAFNVWTAFSIDVFVTLQEMSKDYATGRGAIDSNLDQIR